MATTIKITKKFTQDTLRPRPKWWDDFVGETFEAINNEAWYKLTDAGLKKLNSMRPNKKSYSALVHLDCAEPVIKQGNIVSVFLHEPRKRMYCISNGLVCKILNCEDTNSIEVETIKGKITSYHTLDELKQLVVREDLGNTCHNQKVCDCWDAQKPKCSHFKPTSIDYPLWYEQWQSAVNGEDVNSNKNITFEVMGTPFEEGSQHSQCVTTGKWKLAKIIPA